MTSPPTDLDTLLATLDVADAAVRALYVELAGNPDLVPEYETGLRELLRKRSELAQRVGVAALAEWRAVRAVRAARGTASADDADSDRVGEPPRVLASQGEEDHDREHKTETEAPRAAEPGVPEPSGSTSAAATPTPATPPPPPPSEMPAPVSAQQLEQFKAAFSAPASAPRIAGKADDRTLLLSLAGHVTIADEVSTTGAFEHEVDLLERAAAEERQRRWREMGREARVRWLSLLVAWAKALEEDAFRLHEPSTRVAAAFRELRAFSIHDNPGYVHGFARTATPKWGGTWRMDALYHLREVRPEPAPAPVKPKATAKVKPAPTVEAEDEDEEAPEEALADWAHIERVKGLRVVILGGEVREERRAALERAFQFQSLEWVPTDRPRLVASLAERAERGSVDVILVTKFASHGGSVAIQKSSKAPFLTMRHGYGVTTVRQVLEEYFARGEESSGAKGKGGGRRAG